MNSAFGGLFASMGVAVASSTSASCSRSTASSRLSSSSQPPLATFGAFTALFVTGRPIGISALIGFLMLIGIVVTNAIVLLDSWNA